MAKKQREEVLELIHRRNDLESQESLGKFLEHVVIDCRPEPKAFGLIAEGWQRDRNTWVVPAIEYAAGVRKNYDGPRNFYLGYAKGADKSSYIARCLNWAISYAKRPLRAYCCARDSEQAGVIYDAMQREAGLNDWFGKTKLKFTQRRVFGEDNGARLDILTSDAGGAHGISPDLIVCDEITHWQSSDLWNSVYSAAEKRSGYCTTFVMTNAGYLGSWQDDLRQKAKKYHGSEWFFFEQPVGVHLASWVRNAADSLVKEFLTETEARRLFYNEWLDPSLDGEKLLRPSDVDRCIGTPQYPPANARVVLSIDYGGVHDRTALGAMWWDGKKVHVFEMKCLQGSHENEVQIRDVKSWVEAKFNQFPRCTAVFDKFQLLSVIQDFERAGREVVRIEYRGGKQNFAMAKLLKNLIQNQQVVFTETTGLCGGETLAGELKRLVVKQLSYGLRFDHVANGHDDKSVVLAAGAMEAVGIAPPPSLVRETPPTQSPLPLQQSTSVRLPFSFDHARDRGLFGLR